MSRVSSSRTARRRARGGMARRRRGPDRAGTSSRQPRSPREARLQDRVEAAEQKLREHERLVAELTIHKEELQAQNEALMAAERDLWMARDRFSALFELAPIAYLTMTAGGVITAANVKATQLFGEHPGLLLERPLALYVVSADRLAFRQHLASCRRRRETARVEVSLAIPGGPAPVELSSAMSTDGAIYMAISDLRARRRAAAEQRELAVKAEAARVANQAKDQFLAILSHELRTPLTPVVAAVASLEQMCRRHGLKASETFAAIRRNLSFERRLIDDLLDVTGLAHGKLALKVETVDLQRLVREAADELAEEARRKKVTLELDLRAARRLVRGDADRLTQVFANLLRNAIKFTLKGGQVRVTTQSDRGKLRVLVRDTGIGFRSEERERIFDPFTQGAGAPPREGLGLGLAIARGIMREHKGTLDAESEGPGKGACFTVTLPHVTAKETSRGEEPARRTVARPAGTGRADRRSGSGLARNDPAKDDRARGDRARRPRILFVEDHRDTATVMASILESAGYEVRVAGSIASALALAGQPFEVLVSDIGLPDGSGIELMRRLRARGDIPAIALSGYGGARDLELSGTAGFRHHLVKPIDPDELIEAIRDVAPRRTARRA